MSQQAPSIEPERRISDAPTLSTIPNDSVSDKTTAEQAENKPTRKNNLVIVFLGLQITLFLAALDRYYSEIHS